MGLLIVCLCGLLVIVHIYLYVVNPYARYTLFKNPYYTHRTAQGDITYTRVHAVHIKANRLYDLLGYYQSGFFIVLNRVHPIRPLRGKTPHAVLQQVYRIRFDPTKPYLISGDHFSMLYPRNLGVFYNRLLDPSIAYSAHDRECRLRIALQSTLCAIDGLSVSPTATTFVPIGPTTIAATHVHPGSIASDSVYGMLSMLAQLNDAPETRQATHRILQEYRCHLTTIVRGYLASVVNQHNGLIREDITLSSARDGTHRTSSFYDNVILWKTRSLAHELDIAPTSIDELKRLRRRIQERYWDEKLGYYHNDLYDTSFSSDWLIGYTTGFLRLQDHQDCTRATRMVDYITSHKLDVPLPIRYQTHNPKYVPWFVRTFVPNYGGTAIWSYWGAEYLTLLARLATLTGDDHYASIALRHKQSYDAAIIRDGGFAETFDQQGNLLVTPFYIGIRRTGWAVQYDYACSLLTDVSL